MHFSDLPAQEQVKYLNRAQEAIDYGYAEGSVDEIAERIYNAEKQ